MTLLRKFFNYIFGKKSKQLEIINFNQERLVSGMNEIGLRLHSYKEDQAMIEIRNLIYIGKNLAILNCATAKDEHERIFMQAKIDSFNEIQHFIDVSIERKVHEAKEGKKPVKGSFNVFRRTNFQAGSAL